MSEVVVLVWDDWEALYIDGVRVSDGHRGRVDRLEAVEGHNVESVEKQRVYPDGGAYATELSNVENYEA